MTRSPHMLRRGILVLVALTWATSAFSATQFVTQIIQSTGNVGPFASLVLASDDPRIGYWGGVRQDMKFASRIAGAWSVETADSTAAIGLHTSVAISGAGEPSISYYDATQGDLKFARKTSGVWTQERVDTVGIVGLYTSIELDGSGEPRVSYYDQTLGNLKYAVWAMKEAGQITDHEVKIAHELAYILTGGDGPPRRVTEQDILDLEREAFLKLAGERKTLERIQHTLKTGKPLRN